MALIEFCNEARYLVLIGPRIYDVIYNRIKYLIHQEVYLFKMIEE